MSPTRRSLLKASAAAGATFAGPLSFFANAAATPQGVDPSVAGITKSYGTSRSVDARGKTIRIQVEVKKFDAFVGSFERFSGLADQVNVENDNVTFEFKKTAYVIENRVS